MKALEKLRDKLANEHLVKMDYPVEFQPDLHGAFTDGFDAATKELRRVIEIQRQALGKISILNHDGPYQAITGPRIAQEAIDKADAILNGEKE